MKKLLLLLLLLFSFLQSFSQVSITALNTSKTENFDALGSTGIALVNGWTAVKAGGSNAVALGGTIPLSVYTTSSNAGACYNTGTPAASDRSIGSLASGSLIPRFGAAYQNNTGTTVSSIDLSAVMEQWRSGSSNTVNEILPFEYSTNATSIADTTATWISFSTMDLNEKLTSTAIAAGVDGNLPVNQTNISGTISSITLSNGAVLYIRWTDKDDAGSDGIYAVDDFSITFKATAIISPKIVANATSLTFNNQTVSVNSAAQSYILTGTSLTTNLLLAVNIPFFISKDNFTFSNAISYTPTEAAASPTVYVRYAPTAIGSATSSILHSSTGATSINITLTGTGIIGDVTPPLNNVNYPKINNVSQTTLDLINNINEAGISYFVLNPANGVVPSALQIKAGQDGNGNFALKSGSFINAANTDATTTITGLTAATAYTIYMVAQDNVPNLQTSVSAINITTANLSPLNTPIIISQYYEGLSVNKWIELTNLSNVAINTASLQLKLALYNISGDAGNINITTTPSQVFNLNVIIPAKGTVIIGNTGNGNEVPYLNATSAAQNSNSVINFNGNDGIALLDASGNITDAFGQGINAKDVSYVRSINTTTSSPTFIADDWLRVSLATVQNAIDGDDPNRIGVHFPPNLPSCVAPAIAATALTFNKITINSISASFTRSTDANEYLVIRSLSNTLTATPVDGTFYTIGTAFGGGVIANKIVNSTFIENDLNSSTNYYYFIFPLNNTLCTGGPKYLITNILRGNQTTKTLLPCATPASQPTNFTITSANHNFVQGSFIASDTADEYLVVMSNGSSLTSNPQNQTVYNVGDQVGGGIVIKRGTGTSFTRNGLTQNTNYNFFIYALNSSCSSGPIYLTNTPLNGSHKTRILDVNNLNFYFGNLHSHSSYSDGNKDDTSKKPEDDYAFAKTAMNLDFLGISEHNHTQAGMSLANWKPGIDAAKNATTSNFVAMHGMEWGVISGGGHVIVYGIDSLIGWEPGENQIFVPKSVYTGSTGLFRIINRHGLNAIATLAHPNTTDYNNISATLDLGADSAIVGTALESGPAFSTNVTYSDPANSMNYLSYYNRMLARGYRIGANIDHDNHNLTFGKHTKARLVVLAPALTENDLLDAMKKMRFYASQDSAARITFTANKQPLGSIFTTSGAPEFSITSSTTSPITSIKLMYGTPKSGINPVEIASSTNGTLTYTHIALNNLATGYYYADIVEMDGSRIITSPIWFTRNDASVKKDQLITLAPNKTVNYGDADFAIGATSDNTEINITYTSSDTNIATISNNNIRILKAGSVSITANQVGNIFYNPAAPKVQLLTISPKPISVIADVKIKIEGSVDPALTYKFSPQLLSPDVFTGTLTRNVGEAVGDYTINQGSVVLNGNYEIKYTPAVFSIVAKPQASISGNFSIPVNLPSTTLIFTAIKGIAPFTFTYNINGGGNQTITTATNMANVNVPTNVIGKFVYTITNIADAFSTQMQNLSTTVTVTDAYQIKAINILSPNSNGKNDKFMIENIDYYPNNTLTIFNRSGRIVYTKKGYANEWDGTFNGSPLPSDTYYYILDFGTKIAKFKGYITIIRN